MRNIRIIACLLILTTAFASGAIPVKADTATANDMRQVFRAMYRVDEAEAILKQNKEILRQYKKTHATAYELAMAQASVNNASNLVNTLNTMVERNTILVKAAPPGVINPPSYGANSLFVQKAWSDYYKNNSYLILFPTTTSLPLST